MLRNFIIFSHSVNLVNLSYSPFTFTSSSCFSSTQTQCQVIFSQGNIKICFVVIYSPLSSDPNLHLNAELCSPQHRGQWRQHGGTAEWGFPPFTQKNTMEGKRCTLVWALVCRIHVTLRMKGSIVSTLALICSRQSFSSSTLGFFFPLTRAD